MPQRSKARICEILNQKCFKKYCGLVLDWVLGSRQERNRTTHLRTPQLNPYKAIFQEILP